MSRTTTVGEFLEEQGFREYAYPGSRLFQKRVQDAPKVYVNVYLDSFPEIDHYPITIEVREEYAKDLWAQLRVYALTESQVRSQLDALIDDLLRAWKALQR